MASGIEGMADFEVGIKFERDEAIPSRVALLGDRFTLGAHRRLVLATPVDTGFHRNCWNASLGTPDERTPTPGLDSYPMPELPTGVPGSQGAKTAFEPRYITNAGPAITFLNEGSSQQAPAHFVQQAIEEELREAGG